MHTDRRPRDRGFSFIELLAYMAIAALLILAAIPQFENFRGSARDANTRDDVKSVAQAIEAWAIDNPGETFPYVNVAWDASNGTLNERVLTDNGARLSDGTRLIVRDRVSYVPSAADAGVSYCIAAYNPEGARYDGVTGILDYDSANGGLGHDCRNAPAATSTYAWDGTPGNSTSTASVGGRTYRNLVSQTSCAEGGSWSTRWFGSGGSGARACHAADASMDRAYERKTWTQGGGNQDIGTSVSIPVTPGKTYTISGEARSSWPTTQAVFPEWRDASGNGVTASGSWWTGAHADANEWMRVSNVVEAPPGAATLILVWGPYPLYSDLTSRPTADSTLDLAKPMVLEGAVDLPFFDGASK